MTTIYGGTALHHITAIQLMQDGLVLLAACQCGALIRGRGVAGIEASWAAHRDEVTA